MKLWEFCIFLFGIGYSLGRGINNEEVEKPLRFLVLQKSDFIGDDDFSKNSSNSEEVPTTSSPNDDENVDINDDPAVTEKPNFHPPSGWEELKFPVVPEASKYPPTKIQTESQNTTSILKSVTGRMACQCGVAATRVVGGEVARINDMPWTVSLVRNGFFGFGASKKPYCGGTLINDRYVATASHCVDAMLASGIKVWLNDEDLLISSDTTGRMEFLVDQIIMNPDYDRRTVNNDIALIKLSGTVPIDSPETYIRPACIPANNEFDFSGLTATVAGWGLTQEGGSVSSVLRKVDVPIMTNEKCNSDETKYAGKISENMLCAGYDEGGRDACQGDSGGPLTIDNNGRKTLVGIVSWGFGCAQPKSPGVYTRVGGYPQWILDVTKEGGAEWCGE